jgi:antitoxin (DNA-binding transcriptional repressor) of toxin-antitoxin stability system
MQTVTIEEAQANLANLIAHLQPGEPLVITDHEKPIARLTTDVALQPNSRKAGSAKGILFVSKDDKEHLAEFDEYME